MPQPIRSFVDAAGKVWLQLDNGHRIPLPVVAGEEDGPWGYVRKIGDTMSGTLIMDGGDIVVRQGRDVKLDGPPDTSRAITFHTNGLNRWAVVADASGEPGGNAGSDLVIGRYDDDGTGWVVSLRIDRATGDPAFHRSVSIKDGKSLTLDGAATDNRQLLWKAGGVNRWNLFAEGGTGNSDLYLGRYDDAGAWVGSVLIVDRATGEVRVTGELRVDGYATTSVTPSAGWSANSVWAVKQAGWTTVTVDALKKATAPANGDVMFTMPVGWRPAASPVLWVPIVANAASTGGGLKTWLGSMSQNGQMQIRTSFLPPANELLYFSVAYPSA